MLHSLLRLTVLAEDLNKLSANGSVFGIDLKMSLSSRIESPMLPSRTCSRMSFPCVDAEGSVSAE
ncbi:MAG: hypothetical protein R3C49_06930 [Planctomycetaceae bacterium]